MSGKTFSVIQAIKTFFNMEGTTLKEIRALDKLERVELAGLIAEETGCFIK